ncbi:hypothetical protein [Fuchsiella alkaliacetigena]|uniref:hypothetical protein n=1 Tax=Fuchsiella alkaliacetigena TaxID=957042 RepID=UPI00200AA920|nr:hypothetical protein [Fuchsiella alkaliacetigena]MCK8824197.1 hypothetical protein [Fuchsiella alkaliacetigena]
MKRITCIIILLLFLTLLIPRVEANQLSINNDSFTMLTTEQDGIAQVTLKRVADRERTQRRLSAGLLIGAGAGSYIYAATLDDSGDKRTLRVTGGVFASLGLLQLVVPSTEEREYRSLADYQPEQRELAAKESMAYLADRAERERVLSGISNAGLAIYYLFTQPYEDNSANIYSGLIFGGTAFYQFNSKSYVEEAYERIERAERSRVNAAWIVGEYTGPMLMVNF